MTNDNDRLYNSIDATPARSRLEPYREVILRWRRKHPPISYRRIAAALAGEGVTVTVRAVWEFVQRRTRSRAANESQCKPVVDTTANAQIERKPMGAEEDMKPRRTPEELAAMRVAANAANHTPLFRPDEPVKFHYDPDRPLSNQPTGGTHNGSNSRSDQ